MAGIAQEARGGVAARADVTAKKGARLAARFRNFYGIECRDREGRLKWQETAENLVVDEGLDDVLDKYFKGSAYTAAFFVGLAGGMPTVAAADTMTSHAGWTEVTGYSEAARPALTLGAVSVQSVDNSAAKASYAVNASVTVGGAFVTTDQTKGGITGTLFGVAAFAGGDRSAVAGDTINVTVTLTQASA